MSANAMNQWSESEAHDQRAMREDLAAAFRWTARLGMHEAVANHFSVAVNDAGTRFLINPNQMHFERIRASDLLLLDADDPSVLSGPDAPDPTAWGLHASIHRRCPHARCVLHLHPHYATALACLADSSIPPIDQNACLFYGRHVVDDGYDGLAFESEGERCARLLDAPEMHTMIMGNHGVLVIGNTIAQAFDRMYYLERAAMNYLTVLSTGQPLRRLSHEVAEKTAHQLASYPDQGQRHLEEIKRILDREQSDYRD